MTDKEIENTLRKIDRTLAGMAARDSGIAWGKLVNTLLAAALVGAFGWSWAQAHKHETDIAVLRTRVTVIESNRFTTRDGVALQEKFESKFPQAWLREDAGLRSDISEIKSELQSIDERLRKIENRK